jgi:hypothetical protein
MDVLKPTVDTHTNIMDTSTLTSSGGRDECAHMFNVQQVLALKCSFATSSAASNNNADDADADAFVAARKMTSQRQWATAFAQSNDTTTTDDLSDDDSYDNDSSFEDEYCTTSDDEQETLVAKAMVKAAFSRTLSAPAFAKLMGNNNANDICDTQGAQGVEPSPKRARLTHSTSATTETMTLAQSSRLESSSMKRVGGRLSMVDSAPVLKWNSHRCTITTTGSNNNTRTKTMTKPDDYLRSLLAKHGASTKTFSALETTNFFLQVTTESVEAYDMQIVKAVRNSDVTTLRQLLQSGRSLQCGNKFGESIVHTACRRGSLTVLQFLLQEAAVSCRVICDYGRTPLHDACWTSEEPNFQLMDLLLTACPDLLHVTDARGFLPLAYVRQGHWDAWCRYLKSKNVQQLAARELV